MSTEVITNVLPNIDAHINRYADGRFAAYELYPHSGYVIHDPSGDYNGTDPDGNQVYEPYYTYGGTSIIDENYNWEENPRNITAVLISSLPPGTMIFGTNEPEHEIM